MAKEKSILEKLQENSTQDIMAAIYGKINELFGEGNQFFAMEFPSRPLNSKDYEYNTDDCYSVLTKPYPVQEAEFTLSNQLYDVSPIVQGPNGEKLSTVYSTILNNFVPKLQALEGFVNDQKNLRQWLMTHVTDDVQGTTRSLSRMSLSKELYAEFLNLRNDWNEEKNKKYDSYKKAGDLEGYARWLSSTGIVEEEKINNLYNDAVVRGHYHEVLTLLGFLNVSSPAEILEDTKQKMRASIRRSLDASSDVFPVQFQPSDWFKSLRPNMSPKDLTMTTESLIADYKAKKARMSRLQAQLSEIGVIEVSVEQQQALEDRIKSCEKQLADSEQKLIESYGKGTVDAIKTAISIYKEINPVMKAAEIAEELNDLNKTSSTKTNVLEIIGNVIPEVMKSIADTYDKQENVLRQHKELTDAKMAYAEAKVKDKRLTKLRIEEKIKSVQDDLDFLSPLVMGVIAEQGKNDAVPESGDESLMTDASSETDDFMDVIIKCDESGSFSSSSTSTTAEDRSSGVGGWFWSYGSRSSSSSGASAEEVLQMNKKIEIGFRAKKVVFERGGWFNPNIFKLSNNYFRLADIRASGGLTKEQIKNAAGYEALKRLKTYRLPNDTRDIDYTLQAFPTGFIIAKDITIRIQSSKTESNTAKDYMQSNSSSSGGILCFRCSQSKSASSNSETAYFGNTDNFFYIRIPGPQILGWFLEFTAADNSTPYERLDPKLYADTLKTLVNQDKKIQPKTEEKQDAAKTIY